jgi:rRNA-processing protein FCF1
MTLEEALARYRSAGVLVDANLLLLYVVGAHDREMISSFKRTAKFTPEDFLILTTVLDTFHRVVTTPHVLTEVSNLAGQLKEHLKPAVFQLFAQTIQVLSEEYVPAREVSSHPAFSGFGLTDTAILQQARGKYLVLTEDFRLSQYLGHQGVDVLNFNHLRTYLLS